MADWCGAAGPVPDDRFILGAVFARGGSARLESLDAWQMQSVWPELTHLEGR